MNGFAEFLQGARLVQHVAYADLTRHSGASSASSSKPQGRRSHNRHPASGWLALDLTPPQLKLLERVQGVFHPLPMSGRRAATDPVPALHEKLLPLPVGFEVEAGNDPIPD